MANINFGINSLLFYVIIGVLIIILLSGLSVAILLNLIFRSEILIPAGIIIGVVLIMKNKSRGRR